jgi:hypothetical protein
MNEVIGFAAVIVSIFAGILFQHGRMDRLESKFTDRLDRLESKLNLMQSELTGRIDRVQSDLAQFYRELGRHDAKIESIEKKAS